MIKPWQHSWPDHEVTTENAFWRNQVMKLGLEKNSNSLLVVYAKFKCSGTACVNLFTHTWMYMSAYVWIRICAWMNVKNAFINIDHVITIVFFKLDPDLVCNCQFIDSSVSTTQQSCRHTKKLTYKISIIILVLKKTILDQSKKHFKH